MNDNQNQTPEGYRQDQYRQSYNPSQPQYQQPYQQQYHGQYQQQNPYQQQAPYTQQIIVNQEKKSNGLGTAGFVLALLSLLLCWVPVLDFILWLLGAIFSVIGLFKAPRGLAIAGTVISFLGIIILILFFGALIGLSGMAAL